VTEDWRNVNNSKTINLNHVRRGFHSDMVVIIEEMKMKRLLSDSQRILALQRRSVIIKGLTKFINDF
jgi:hypothetical protein